MQIQSDFHQKTSPSSTWLIQSSSAHVANSAFAEVFSWCKPRVGSVQPRRGALIVTDGTKAHGSSRAKVTAPTIQPLF